MNGKAEDHLQNMIDFLQTISEIPDNCTATQALINSSLSEIKSAREKLTTERLNEADAMELAFETFIYALRNTNAPHNTEHKGERANATKTQEL